MPNKQKHYAIVIGINDYPLIGLDPLKGPVNDANDFYDWLRDPEGGDVPVSNIRRILSTEFGRQTASPTPNQIESLFEPFIIDGVQGRIGERLYVFAAGHGFGDPSDIGKTALYAANAKRIFPWHVAVTDYVEWLRRHAVFDELVLIMDCCRTVHLQYTIREPQYLVSAGNPGADKVRYFYAFAVGRGGAARERQFDDGRNSGVFTKAILDGLRNARPEHGAVTGQALKNHIHNSIDKFAVGMDIAPPEIQLDSSRDITFSKRKSAGTAPVRIRLAPPYTGAETLTLYDGRETRQLKAESADLTLELEPGLYKIAVKNTSRQIKIEVPNNEQFIV